MSGPLPALIPDDPLASAPPTRVSPGAPEVEPKAVDERPRPAKKSRRRAPAPAAAPTSPTAPVEIAWSGTSEVTTLKMPTEVLRALDDRRGQLGLPKGYTVAAAILALLERDDSALRSAVEAVEERVGRARRDARRPPRPDAGRSGAPVPGQSAAEHGDA